MQKNLGKCKYCDNGTISYDVKEISGRKTKLYRCSNNKVHTEDGEVWERTSDSTCGFRIFGNSLLRYGKKFIGPKEVKKLLEDKETIVTLYSYAKKCEYKKYLTLDPDYGVSVVWDIEVAL